MKKLKSFLLWAAGLLFVIGCLAACSFNTQADPNGGTAVSPDSSLEIHYIDVGQGDAALIKNGSHAMLFDAGQNDQGTKIQAYLQSQGVTSLDYLIVSHPDSDHEGGADVILTKFDCETVIMPDYDKDTATHRDVLKAMEYKGYQNTLPVVGASYSLGDASFTIIAPNKSYGDHTNDYSVGMILTFGENRFLFTGDAETEAEADIVRNGIDISADVYQVGHHGSSTSSSDELLDQADPSFAVISCGEGNSYGHPRAETLNKFRQRGIQVFRTDEQGTIVAVSDGSQITWNSSPSETWKSGEPTAGQQQPVPSTELPSQNASVSYVLNTNTKKFHLPDCSGLPTKNRQDSSQNREELIRQGYEPCKQCNP